MKMNLIGVKQIGIVKTALIGWKIKRWKMGMTIDSASKLLSVIVENITEDDDYFTIEDENLQILKETLLTAISTMRKYQKIEQILKDIPYGGEVTVRRIQEVVENEKG